MVAHVLPKQVLPKNLNLAEQKPDAVNSYVRRFRNIQQGTTGTSVPGQEIIIPIDTSTPGAFLDVAMSYLQFDLEITNKNPYIDYIDFGPAGALSVFEQLQIRNNGLAIETIYDFNTVNETWSVMEGLQQQYLELYQSRLNTMSVGTCTTDNDFNTAKPPMIDLTGHIMGAQKVTYAATTNGGLSTSYGPNVTFTHNFNTAASGNETGPWYGSGVASNPVMNYDAGTYATVVNNLLVKPGMYARGFGTQNINCWPQMIGIETNNSELQGKAPLRYQDYMTMLAHVRNIPIGCTTKLLPATNGGWVSTDSWTNNTDAVKFNYGTFTITVTVPLLCGTFGILQSKMVPVMLLDNVQFVFTVAAASKALKVSMDPCRRIPGTHRDFLTYYGNKLGLITPGDDTASILANSVLPSVLNGGGANTTLAIAADAITAASALNQGIHVIQCPLTGVAGGANISQAGTWQYNYFPAGGLVPQYIQSAQCNADTTYPAQFYGNALVQVGNDAMGCYGTKLKSSVAQTARCIKNGVTSIGTYTDRYSATNQGTPDSMPSIAIRNIVYVAQQVVVPDFVTAEILTAAMGADISLQTQSIQVYRSITVTQGSGTQNIVIPAKVGSANTMLCVFRSATQLTVAPKQYLVNSLCGICPFARAEFKADTTSYVGTIDVPTLDYVRASGATGFSAQLVIGNDLVPLQPMNSIVEIVTELEKSQHGLNTRYNNMSLGNPIKMLPNTTAGGTSIIPVFDIYKDGGFCTPWIDPDFLDDQTIINNALMPLLTNTQTGTPWVSVPVGPFKAPLFKHPDSKFILGFDLDTWSAFSDVAMSGRYLGNNTVSVQLQGAKAFESSEPFFCTAIVMCAMRWSFQAGGSSQTFV